MKLKVPSEKVNGLYLGFKFEKGVAEVPKEEEARAKSIAVQLGYEIEEGAKKTATRKPAAKKKADKE